MMTAPAPITLAMRDAIRTVELWQRVPPRYRARVCRHVARALRCYPAWGSIQAALVRRLLDESNAARPA